MTKKNVEKDFILGANTILFHQLGILTFLNALIETIIYFAFYRKFSRKFIRIKVEEAEDAYF